MLGIPLYLTLFGTAHMFKIGVLDLAQAMTCIGMIAILSADMGGEPEAGGHCAAGISFSHPDHSGDGPCAQTLWRDEYG